MTTVGMPQLRYTPSPEANELLQAEELAELAERAQALTDAPGVMIALRLGNELVVRTSDGIAPEVGSCIPFPSGVTGLCVTSRKPQTSGSADVEAQLEASFRALDVHSVLAVPIAHGGETCGVLAVLSQAPAVFSRTHVAVLMTLADVIGSKLAQYPLASDVASKGVSGEVLEIDVHSVLGAAAPEATLAPPKFEVPRPSETVAIAVQPAKTIALPRVATMPAAPVEKIAPISTPSRPRPAAMPLTELLKQLSESPVPTNPDVLSPAEDPMKHLPVVARPLSAPAIRGTAKSASVLPAVDLPYRTQKSKRSHIPLFATCAAIVVLGVAAALYSRLKPAAPAATASVAAEPAPLTAVPISAVAVSTPKSVEQSAPTATPEPAVSATSAPRDKDKEATPTAPQPKPAVEATTRKPAPILQLASGQPKAKSAELVESPALALMAGSGKALSDLPIVSAPATPAVNKPVVAVLVPAKRVRGAPPHFPPEARRLGRSGLVELLISISAEGKVTDARVLTGDLMLRTASISAVREWVYTPARLDGKPVASTAEVSLRFNAER